LEVLILISVVSMFCQDLHRAILALSCIILVFCATNLFLVLVRLIAVKNFNRAINHD